MNFFIFFTVKNSYLIYVWLKNLFFFEGFLQYSTYFCIISLKKILKLNLNQGPKVVVENFIRTTDMFGLQKKV